MVQLTFLLLYTCLEFDEYFSTDQSEGNYIISPSQQSVPKIEIKKKKLIIELLDSLKENTTYSFNFYNYISDINENNKIEQLKYVFSTWSYLDSNIIAGSVLSYPQLSPAENIWVLAYRFSSNKDFINQTADFITKTNNKGEFKLEHLPDDSFQLLFLMIKIKTGFMTYLMKNTALVNQQLHLKTALQKS